MGGIIIINFDKEFDNLKRSLKGKNDYLFLVHDSNDEIKQHYDSNFKFSVDLDKFRESQLSKQEYCNMRNINYKLFVIPDRSVVLKNHLPFDVGEPYRMVDELSDVAIDLLPLFYDVDYIPTDTHITPLAAIKCGIYMLYMLHSEKPLNYYANLIWSSVILELSELKGDLISPSNWSYDFDEYYKKYVQYQLFGADLKHSYSEVNNELPPEFKKVGKRKTFYYRNENSISDKICLFFTASSGIYGKIPLIAYYREIIYYWDHWYFNQDLIDWFKPDDIIELRVERFLENPLCPIVKEGYYVKIPLNMEIINYKNEDNTLIISVDIKDYHMMPITTQCSIFVDNKLLKRYDICNKIRNIFEIDVSTLENKMHSFRISFESTDKTLSHEFNANLIKIDSGLYMPIYINIQKLNVSDNKLNLKVSFADYSMTAVDSNCYFSIDDKNVCIHELDKKFNHNLTFDINDLTKGKHKLSIHIPQ